MSRWYEVRIICDNCSKFITFNYNNNKEVQNNTEKKLIKATWIICDDREFCSQDCFNAVMKDE